MMKAIKLKKGPSGLLVILCIISLTAGNAHAQLHYNTTASQFFRNRYLLNPAFAGSDSSLRIFGIINRSWLGFDGSPTAFQFSADRHLGKNAGAGLQVATNEAEILRRTQASLSYSYKVPLGREEEYFRLGMSVTSYWEQLDLSALSEEANDPAVRSFNSKGARFDGDFGTYYHNRNFFISATMFNLGKWFSDLPDILPVDLETLRLTGAYTFKTEDDFSIQPLVAAQLYTRTPWLFRAGAEVSYSSKLFASIFWLNNKTIQAGAGMKMGRNCELNFYYGSSNPQRVGELMELALGVNL